MHGSSLVRRLKEIDEDIVRKEQELSELHSHRQQLASTCPHPEVAVEITLRGMDDEYGTHVPEWNYRLFDCHICGAKWTDKK